MGAKAVRAAGARRRRGDRESEASEVGVARRTSGACAERVRSGAEQRDRDRDRVEMISKWTPLPAGVLVLSGPRDGWRANGRRCQRGSHRDSTPRTMYKATISNTIRFFFVLLHCQRKRCTARVVGRLAKESYGGI